MTQRTIGTAAISLFFICIVLNSIASGHPTGESSPVLTNSMAGHISKKSVALDSTGQSQAKIISPVAGQKWQWEVQYCICWATLDVSTDARNNVLLFQLSSDDGATWIDLSPDGRFIQDGGFTVTAPHISSSACRVRLLRFHDQVELDRSAPFTITQSHEPTVTLLAPLPYAHLGAGLADSISWSSNSGSSVSIAFSLDDGLSWQTIASNVTTPASYLNWQIPDTGSQSLRIRISDEADSTNIDITHSPMTIARVKLISPHPGDTLQQWDQDTIRWASENIQRLRLDVSTNGGASWTALFSDVSPQAGQLVYIVPTTLTSGLWRISDEDFSYIQDIPASLIEVAPPQIDIQNPRSKDTLRATNTLHLSWNAQSVSALNFYYSVDAGNTWTLAWNSIPRTVFSFDWNVPSVPGHSPYGIQIKLVDPQNPAAYTIVDSLTILNRIVIIAPHGGENLHPYDIFTIRWIVDRVDTVRIGLLADQSKGWIRYAALRGDSGTYSWIVPNIQAGQCRIQIVDASAPNQIYGESDSTFSITIPNGVGPTEPKILSYSLEQNYPNPFNPSTTIGYTLADRSDVTIRVYSILGVLVASLADGVQETGYHTVQLDGRNLPSGIYYYRITAGTYQATRKLLLLK